MGELLKQIEPKHAGRIAAGSDNNSSTRKAAAAMALHRDPPGGGIKAANGVGQALWRRPQEPHQGIAPIKTVQ
jgi:hypothetical protein